MISIKNLNKSFGSNHVLRDINLEVAKGKITFIIGRSGEGKSVLIKHIIGLLKPDSGEILLDGEDITTMNQYEFNDVLKRFGMLFQHAALFDSLTVGENVGFPLVEHTNKSAEEIRSIVEEKLNRVGLRGVYDMMISELSGGMQKRVGLARAIVMDPEIVLFDEPTTGLDPVMSDSVGELILSTQKALKTTYLAISHDIKLTYQIADHVAMLHEGRIIDQGSVEYIKNSTNPVVKQFVTGSAHGPIKVY